MTDIERKRAYLENYWDIDNALKTNDYEIMEVIADVRGIGAMVYSDMPTANKLTDLSDKMVMYENRMKKLTEEKNMLLNSKWEIINKINDISKPVYRRILYDKYIKGMKINEMSETIGYGERNIRKLTRQAIMSIDI